MQIFPRSLNLLPMVVAVGVVGGGTAVTAAVWYYGSPRHLQVGYAPTQPVPYSHKLHVGQLGIDCRYCHANVERSAEAMIPPTQTCMGCHTMAKFDSPLLAPVRDSWETGESVEWVRVHKLPDHAYFDHSVHLSAGVGCANCHGRVDQMEVVRQAEPINMAWCLDCHRNPAPALRPRDRSVTDMTCALTGASCDAGTDCCSGTCSDGACQALVLASADGALNPAISRMMAPPEHCSGCHR
jgi:hypothetical protein